MNASRLLTCIYSLNEIKLWTDDNMIKLTVSDFLHSVRKIFKYFVYPQNYQIPVIYIAQAICKARPSDMPQLPDLEPIQGTSDFNSCVWNPPESNHYSPPPSSIINLRVVCECVRVDCDCAQCSLKMVSHTTLTDFEIAKAKKARSVSSKTEFLVTQNKNIYKVSLLEVLSHNQYLLLFAAGSHRDRLMLTHIQHTLTCIRTHSHRHTEHQVIFMTAYTRYKHVFTPSIFALLESSSFCLYSR